MAVRKGNNQKLKLLFLIKILNEQTDENHGLKMKQIREQLALNGVNCSRKILYEDFKELEKIGIEVIPEKVGHEVYYRLINKEFELAELKLLVDSIQSAKFITDKKSKELIKKIESLASQYEAKQLQRQVVTTGRIKTMNESIYYNVDKLHNSINNGHKIKFHYFQWNLKKEMELRHDGDWYEGSPWALVWDNEYYYLVAYDSDEKKIKHYRVDKMIHIQEQLENRDGEEEYKLFDMARYSKSLFGMFGGVETKVTLQANNSMVGILIDRFGKDIMIIPVDDTQFKTTVTVALSKQFIGWIMSLGDEVKVIEPTEAVTLMKEEIKRLNTQYSL